MAEKIDIEAIAKKSREQNCQETLQLLQMNQPIFWSWGSHAFKNFKNRVLRFMVHGHHHKGHIYIAVNGADLFDVYYTTNRGTIVDTDTDLYLDMLVNAIDKRVERIKEYVD